MLQKYTIRAIHDCYFIVTDTNVDQVTFKHSTSSIKLGILILKI